MDAEKETWTSYGDALRSLRARHDMSVARLCLLLGVSRTAVQRWEDETLGPPSEEKIRQTEKIFGLKPGTLLGFRQPKHQQRSLAYRQTCEMLRTLSTERLQEVRKIVMRMELDQATEGSRNASVNAQA